MAIIKRLEITFNNKETDLLKHIESQSIPSATYIKQLLRDDMNNNNPIIDYDRIEQIIYKVWNSQYKVPGQQPKQTTNNQNKLLQGFAKKR